MNISKLKEFDYFVAWVLFSIGVAILGGLAETVSVTKSAAILAKLLVSFFLFRFFVFNFIVHKLAITNSGYNVSDENNESIDVSKDIINTDLRGKAISYSTVAWVVISVPFVFSYFTGNIEGLLKETIGLFVIGVPVSLVFARLGQKCANRYLANVQENDSAIKAVKTINMLIIIGGIILILAPILFLFYLLMKT